MPILRTSCCTPMLWPTHGAGSRVRNACSMCHTLPPHQVGLHCCTCAGCYTACYTARYAVKSIEQYSLPSAVLQPDDEAMLPATVGYWSLQYVCHTCHDGIQRGHHRLMLHMQHMPERTRTVWCTRRNRPLAAALHTNKGFTAPDDSGLCGIYIIWQCQDESITQPAALWEQAGMPCSTM